MPERTALTEEEKETLEAIKRGIWLIRYEIDLLAIIRRLDALAVQREELATALDRLWSRGEQGCNLISDVDARRLARAIVEGKG